MNNVAIIPARGGSKRIPRKNIRNFLGKPIIQYSIDAALQSELFATVMVSTDDEEIAEVARKCGASVPFMRSARNSDDHATTVDVLEEVVAQLEGSGKIFQDACCIYATAAFVTAEHLRQGYKKMKDANFDSVFPVVPFSYPIWRGLELVNGKLQMVWREYEKARSQDLKKVYHDAGQWYWFTVNALKTQQTIFTKNSGPFELDDLQVQDIDNLVDWQIAEVKMSLVQQLRASKSSW
jgi:pseudaminic acid cytidylyltransferase